MDNLPDAVIVLIIVSVLAGSVVVTVRVDAGKVLTVPEIVIVLGGSVVVVVMVDAGIVVVM
jgi:hypothetical protein